VKRGLVILPLTGAPTVEKKFERKDACVQVSLSFKGTRNCHQSGRKEKDSTARQITKEILSFPPA